MAPIKKGPPNQQDTLYLKTKLGDHRPTAVPQHAVIQAWRPSPILPRHNGPILAAPDIWCPISAKGTAPTEEGDRLVLKTATILDHPVLIEAVN